jgi:hypothetical protein
MDKMIAYCGIVCTECEAFKATQSGEPNALEKVAASWREQFDSSITAASIACDGCLADSETLCSYCSVCPLRVCALQRQETNCAYCAEFERCEKLETYFSHAPHMREVLTNMRAAR